MAIPLRRIWLEALRKAWSLIRSSYGRLEKVALIVPAVATPAQSGRAAPAMVTVTSDALLSHIGATVAPQYDVFEEPPSVETKKGEGVPVASATSNETYFSPV